MIRRALSPSTAMVSRYAAAHSKPKGPGDSRPTALQIVHDEQRVNAMSDKVIFITGCSSGLGIETARALKATGATLYLAARNLEKARDNLRDILDGGRVHLVKLDLESLDSVRSCVADFRTRSSKLNILINNAGVRLTPRGKTKEGFETQFGTNHVAHFLLFQLLKPVLLASSTPEFQSRVVAVSSTGHRKAPLDLSDLNQERRPYDPYLAYGYSKLANIYMSNEIERRFGSQGLHGWSVHPGGIRTGLQRPNLQDWLIVFKAGLISTYNASQNPEQGAATSVWAAISRELEGKGGKYCERSMISQGPVKKGYKVTDPGYESWTYDEAAAEKLYEMSLEMVSLEGES
ncbi:NAD(P)-binding protein [Thozetella sp. PMI_491]|nr:NAD(P)-binding protein [Thozetella sp. PMI_491]